MKRLAVFLLVAVFAVSAGQAFAGARKPKKQTVQHDKAMLAKLNSITIEHLEVEDASPTAVFKLLRMLSKQKDPRL